MLRRHRLLLNVAREAAEAAAASEAVGVLESDGKTTTLHPFKYQNRLQYVPHVTGTFSYTDFIVCERDRITTLFRTFSHPSGVKVTLIPLLHEAHPIFFKQIDQICCQHDSVLMEGRIPHTSAPYSTIVPPRKMIGQVRPEGHEDDEGWEPNSAEGFWQPFSWGVLDSPNHTVVHAADAYDYEKLPWWMTLRSNIPVLGSNKRDVHCLNMIPPLSEMGYKNFAIPWGVGHMPFMATVLVRNGFTEDGQGALQAFLAVDGLHSTMWCRKMTWYKTYLTSFASAGFIFGCSLIVVVGYMWTCSNINWTPFDLLPKKPETTDTPVAHNPYKEKDLSDLSKLTDEELRILLKVTENQLKGITPKHF